MNTDYYSIGNFGCNSPAPGPPNNPLSYCVVNALENGFHHTLGRNYLNTDSEQCQIFMGDYCADNWDGVCEYAYQDSKVAPNMIGNTVNIVGLNNPNFLTRGQILLRNTAASKYLTHMSSNCERVYEPFDPTVADSVLISKWAPKIDSCVFSNTPYTDNKCTPIYAVDPKSIDNDPVMDKLLAQPYIAMDILLNIYNNAVRNNTLQGLRNTKIYNLFMSGWFQNIASQNKGL